MRCTLHGNLRSLGASLRRPIPFEVLVLPASQGLAPREGLELLMLKLGCTKTSMEPHNGSHVLGSMLGCVDCKFKFSPCRTTKNMLREIDHSSLPLDA